MMETRAEAAGKIVPAARHTVSAAAKVMIGEMVAVRTDARAQALPHCFLRCRFRQTHAERRHMEAERQPEGVEGVAGVLARA